MQIEPFIEEGHRQLMRLLVYSGRRGAALAQYETWRQMLADELGVEPEKETDALLEQIRLGELETPTTTPEAETGLRPPAFLATGVEEEPSPPPVFVARERELGRLDAFLQQALAGHGRVVLVTGGPGRGKTALLHEFARQAMAAQPGLLVAIGSCNAYSGVGDPYLPFREVMAMLTGDVESRWAAGTISRGHAQRLWSALPDTVQALLEHGPHIIPAMVPGTALLSRCASAATDGSSWLRDLRELVARAGAHAQGLEQSNLFQQFTNILRALAENHPLLLILDDLQWADAASTGLLFHLGRRLENSRILIAGAYRPEEIALGRDGERHPLEKVISELRRTYGDVLLDLSEVKAPERQHLVEALLATEPNRLREKFRTALFEHTGGHPLFTVELLRAMQERGDLVQAGGEWVEGTNLDWDRLPARVEAVIEERINRLEDELRDILSVASVEGERFTAQVVARVRQSDERQLFRHFSQQLERRHRLVRGQEERQIGTLSLSRYRFSHALYQQYLYSRLSPGECRLLHGEIASVLEELYAENTEMMAVQLARHYGKAADEDRALKYETLAAKTALSAYANREAEAHYRRALELARTEAERAHLLAGLGSATQTRLGREGASDLARGHSPLPGIAGSRRRRRAVQSPGPCHVGRRWPRRVTAPLRGGAGGRGRCA